MDEETTALYKTVYSSFYQSDQADVSKMSSTQPAIGCSTLRSLDYVADNLHSIKAKDGTIRANGLIAKLRPHASTPVIWYTVRRFFLSSLIALLLFGMVHRRFAIILTLCCLKQCFLLLLQPRSNLRMETAFSLLVCLFSGICWISSICVSIVGARPTKQKREFSCVLMVDAPLGRRLILAAKRTFRQCVILCLLLLAVFIAMKAMLKNSYFKANGGSWFRALLDSAMALCAFNLADILVAWSATFCPLILDLPSVCDELQLGSRISEFLSLHTLNQAMAAFDSQLYSTDLWPRLADLLVFRAPVHHPARIRVLCSLITRSYQADNYGVVQLQLGTYIEKLIDLMDDLSESDDVIHFELTNCLRAVAIRFGDSLESCGISRKHMIRLKQIVAYYR